LSDNKTDLIAKLHSEGMAWYKIASEVGLTTGGAKSRLYRRKMADRPRATAPDSSPGPTTKSEDGDAIAIFRDKKQTDGVEWRGLLDLATATQVAHKTVLDTQYTAEIEISTDRPVALVFTGDWHLGDTATDYESWMKDIQFILDTPNVFMLDLGDSVQNVRSFKNVGTILSQALSPKLQGLLLRGIIDELTDHGKLLAKVTGNHDGEFDERIFGEVLQAYLLDKMQAPRFDNRGLIHLTVGSIRYSILLFHKSRFRSFMRPTHGNYREMQMSYPADIVAGAHDHAWGFEAFDNYDLAKQAGDGFGGVTFLVRVGSYQVDSPYGWRYFHNARPVSPVVILWPNEKRMQPVFRLEDALAWIK
jgi:hypothetical protein